MKRLQIESELFKKFKQACNGQDTNTVISKLIQRFVDRDDEDYIAQSHELWPQAQLYHKDGMIDAIYRIAHFLKERDSI